MTESLPAPELRRALEAAIEQTRDIIGITTDQPTPIKWHVGMAIDHEGKVTHFTFDANNKPIAQVTRADRLTADELMRRLGIK